MSAGKPHRDTAYDRLLGDHYGGHRAVRHPVTRRWLARSAEELLSGYFGRSRRSIRGLQAAPPVSVAASLDDGETLRAAGGGAVVEDYVVERYADAALAQSLSDDPRLDGGFEEYVVEWIPGDDLARAASLADATANPRAECQIDLLDPLARSAERDDPAPPPRSNYNGPPAAQPVLQDAPARSGAASRSPAGPTAPDASTASDDDFMADIQSILSGQSQYDPAAKKTLPKPAAAAAAPPPANNSQEIFDKIAASMQYAQTYDLGTVELENRFAEFDRGWEAEQKRKHTGRRPDRSAASPATPGGIATTEDFIEDLDSLRREALDRAGVGAAAAGYGQGAMPGAQTGGATPSFAMATGPTDLNGAFVAAALQTVFASASDINAYFARLGAVDFIDWFSTNLANVGPWAGKAIAASAAARANFNAIWDRIPQIFGSPQINLLQFASLMTIFVNEVGGGGLGPISEKVGTKDHPGLAYAFDRIPHVKQSYNADGSNWTALRCFNDAAFIAAHGQKALGNQLQNTADQAWSGSVYPPGVPTDVDPAKTGFIMEADFYKFRGRGLIQTTWRSAYLKLIKFVQSYGGTQAIISALATAWAGLDPDAAASSSSNADWDNLFMHSNLEIPCVAIAQHSAAGNNYLSLSGDVDVLNGHHAGSIWRMGRTISGGDAYADLFRRRVIAICNLLGN